MKTLKPSVILYLLTAVTSVCLAYEPRYNPTMVEINGVGALKTVGYIRELDGVQDWPLLGVVGGGLYVCPIGILGTATNTGKNFAKIIDILIGYQLFHNLTYTLQSNDTLFDTTFMGTDTAVNSSHTYWSHSVIFGLRRNVAPFVDLAVIAGAGLGTNRLLRDATMYGLRPDSADIKRRKLTTFIMPGLEFMVPFGNFAAKLGVYVRKEFHRDAEFYVPETLTGYYLMKQDNLHIVASVGIIIGHGKNEAREKRPARDAGRRAEEAAPAAGDADAALREYDALDRTSAQAINAYLMKYPSSMYAEVLTMELDNLVISDYRAAVQENSAESYRRFLDQYPASGYCEALQPWLKYREAIDVRDPALLSEFLKTYASHELAPLAAEALENIKQEWTGSIYGQYDSYMSVDAASVGTASECDSLITTGENLINDMSKGAAVYGMENDLSSKQADIADKVRQLETKKADLQPGGY